MARVRGDRGLDLAARVERLTAGQRACLDLVDEHATSKEIALKLGISRHTVDARLRQAMQILDVGSRREAAMIWRAASGADGYQPFAYQPPQIETGVADGDIPAHDRGHPPSDLRPLAPDDRAAADERPAALSAPSAAMGLGPALRPDARLLPAGEVADTVSWAFAGAPFPEPPADRRPSLRLWGGANDLTPVQRLAGILVVTILAMLAFGLLLSGIAALTQLRS